jgi:hypothetical protein
MMTNRLQAARVAGCAARAPDLSTVRVEKAGRWSYWVGDRMLGLRPHEVFVFGSNRAGRHGRGAAVDAVRRYGARYGVGEGLVGQSYALPTKGERLEVLTLGQIGVHVGRFLALAAERRDLRFYVTEVGCGLAGYSPADVAPLFEAAPENVVLPARFVDALMEPMDALLYAGGWSG